MQTKPAPFGDDLMTVSEAAAVLRVSIDTLKRWERAGRVTALRTPYGHRRFRRADIDRLLAPGAGRPSGVAG